MGNGGGFPPRGNFLAGNPPPPNLAGWKFHSRPIDMPTLDPFFFLDSVKFVVFYFYEIGRSVKLGKRCDVGCHISISNMEYPHVILRGNFINPNHFKTNPNPKNQTSKPF